MNPDFTRLSHSARRIGVKEFAVVALTALCAVPAHAQSLEDRLRDQLRTTLNTLHDAQDRQTQLQAQKAAAEKERDDLKVQLAAAKAQLAHATHNTAETNALQAEIAKYKDASTQATAGAQQTASERDQLKTDIAGSQKQLGICEDKNTALLKTGRSILDSYEQFDFGDAIGANEPFVAIKRVELENIAQDFDDQLHAGRFDPHAKPPTGSTSGAH